MSTSMLGRPDYLSRFAILSGAFPLRRPVLIFPLIRNVKTPYRLVDQSGVESQCPELSRRFLSQGQDGGSDDKVLLSRERPSR